MGSGPGPGSPRGTSRGTNLLWAKSLIPVGSGSLQSVQRTPPQGNHHPSGTDERNNGTDASFHGLMVVQYLTCSRKLLIQATIGFYRICIEIFPRNTSFFISPADGFHVVIVIPFLSLVYKRIIPCQTTSSAAVAVV